MENLVKWVARAEGLSLLLLFFVAMPLKYGAGIVIAVEIVGWIHGMLFLAFVAMLGLGRVRLGWSMGDLMLGFVSSLLPFGTFVWERRVLAAAESPA